MSNCSVTRDSRGVSEVVGFVVLLGIVVGGTMTILAIGGGELAAMQDNYETQQGELAMTNFDSKSSLVALGASSSQTLDLGAADDVVVDPEEGWANITIIGNSGNRTVLTNTTLGEVRAENGDTDLVYQGGGVWRYQDNHSRMVTPPEFHYRDQTLTFPLVTVSGPTQTSSSRVTVENNGTTRLYPNETLSNPVEGGTVRVEIGSRYHEGWRQYFEERTDGEVEHQPAKNRVAVNLTAPLEGTFGASISTTAAGSDALDPEMCVSSDDGGNGNGNGNGGSPNGFECPTETGANLPSASSQIDDRISECESGGCLDLAPELTNNYTLLNGTYYHDGDYTLGNTETELDTTDGPINIVIDGDVTFKGNGGSDDEDIGIVGDNGTTLYVKGEVTGNGNDNFNGDGDPSNLLMLVHSNVSTVDLSGTSNFTGMIYAPNSNFTITGGGSSTHNVRGSVVANTADAGGNGYVEYDESLAPVMDFDFDPELTYLHVTKNSINVTGR